MDYTISGLDELTFGGPPEADDVVTIDYNITECRAITQRGDNDAPYSGAWDADSGNLVPSKTYSETTHYDLIATAIRSFGEFDSCEEECHSDGYALPIRDTDAPDFDIWGLLCDNLEWNYPGNPLCESCGGNDLVGEVGDCKCKLSGIEHQIFVTGDDDIASVEMSVGGDPAVSFDMYEEGDTIYVPISFDLDTMADEVLNGWNSKAVNPDSVENVTIDIDGIGVSNVAMTDLGDGWFQYVAMFIVDSGDRSYDYEFHIDYVGDNQTRHGTSDPCWEGSDITIPGGEFWCYDISDPASFWGVNEVDQVTFTVTDDEGNVSNNLMSGSRAGAAGQIWVTYDPTPQEVKDIWVSETIVGPGDEIQVNVEVPDPVPATADIITLEGVIIQASVDDTMGRWRTIFTDYVNNDPGPFWTTDGGWGGTFDLPDWMNPADDGIDNDRDGETDEADEEVYTYKLRVVTVDDCCNYGYSCSHPRAQANEICAEITVDSSIPQACLISPIDGSIHTIGGDPIDLIAATDDDDVDYVMFQYMLNDTWYTIDPTPLNDDDDPYVYEANGDGNYVIENWDTGFLAERVASDFYLRMRAVAVDHAGNEQSDDDDLVCDINIVLNDTTGPTSAITNIESDCFPNDPVFGDNQKRIYDPTLAISGEVYVRGRAYGWNQWDVATVTVEISPDGTSWEILGVDNEFFTFNDLGAQFCRPLGFRRVCRGNLVAPLLRYRRRRQRPERQRR